MAERAGSCRTAWGWETAVVRDCDQGRRPGGSQQSTVAGRPSGRLELRIGTRSHHLPAREPCRVRQRTSQPELERVVAMASNTEHTVLITFSRRSVAVATDSGGGGYLQRRPGDSPAERSCRREALAVIESGSNAGIPSIAADARSPRSVAGREAVLRPSGSALRSYGGCQVATGGSWSSQQATRTLRA